MKTKLLTLVFALFCISSAGAQEIFEQNGLLYYITSENEATVYATNLSDADSLTFIASDSTIVIPNQVTYNDKDYPVTSIGSNAFASVYQPVKKIILPENLKNIGDGAFWGLPITGTLDLPQNLKYIGNSAFYGCAYLTDVTLPDSLQSIGSAAFYGCSSLTEITLPKNIQFIGVGAFTLCSSLTSLQIAADAPYFATQNGILFNKEKTTLLKYPDKKTATSYRIPMGVTTVSDYAFAYVPMLTSITCPAGADSIGHYAFAACPDLTKITLPASFTKMGNGPFALCHKLTTLSVAPDNPSYTSDNNILFNKQKNVLVCYPAGKQDMQYEIPAGVTEIGSQAFYGCSALTQINIPQSVTKMGPSAFNECTLLETVNIPEAVTVIPDYCFSECDALKSIIIPNQVTRIDYGAFSGCLSLASVQFSQSLVTIGTNAFSNTGLTAVYLPNTVKEIGVQAFFNCQRLKSIHLPEGLTQISDGLLFNCASLDSIHIPSSVTSIGVQALCYCENLRSLTIPASVTQIYYMALGGNHNLTTLRCEAVTPPTTDFDVFIGIPTDIPVYVPKESIEQYQSAPEWSNFTNYQGFLTAIPSVEAGNISVSQGTLRNPQGLPLKIYDMSGRQVYQGSGHTVNLPKGIYVVRCGQQTLKAAF